jgi:predicted PurR-regulated permease PerM
MTNEQSYPFYIKAPLILIGTIAFLYVLYLGQSIFVPLVFALFISILVNPIVNFLIRHKVPRIIAIFVGLLVVMILTAALLFFISMQFSMFAKTYPELKLKFTETGNDLVNWCALKMNLEPDAIINWISDTGKKFLDNMTGSLGATILTVGNALVLMVLIPVEVFLILFYKHLLLEFIRKLFNQTHHKAVADVLYSINGLIRSYLFGLVIEGVIVATLNSVGLLVLGIRYAIILGITGAILNVIPYIGGIIAFALPMITAFVTKSPISAVWVFVVYTVIQFIDNHYLVPYVVASKVKINALIAIVVVLAGNFLWGIPGMFLAIPLTALIKVVCDHIEPLKPYGFLLGDTVPPSIKLPFAKKSSK